MDSAQVATAWPPAPLNSPIKAYISSRRRWLGPLRTLTPCANKAPCLRLQQHELGREHPREAAPAAAEPAGEQDGLEAALAPPQPPLVRARSVVLPRSAASCQGHNMSGPQGAAQGAVTQTRGLCGLALPFVLTCAVLLRRSSWRCRRRAPSCGRGSASKGSSVWRSWACARTSTGACT